MIESFKNNPNEHNAALRQKSSRANDHCVSTLRWMLMLMFIASAAPASARTENPAVIMLIETAASKITSGTFNQAASVVERALHIEPDNAWIWHLLARIHHLQSDYEMARNMAEKSSNLAGSDSALKAQNTWLITVADQASRRLKTGTAEGVRTKGRWRLRIPAQTRERKTSYGQFETTFDAR